MKRPARAPPPLVTAGIVATILAVFAVELLGNGQALCQALGFTSAHPSLGTAFASMWLHDPDHVAHIAGNLAALAVLGAVVEPVLGHARFALLYVLSGLGGCAMHWLADPNVADALVGCSACCSGLLAVVAMVRPRLIGFALGFMAWQLWCLWTGSGGAVSVTAHVGGFVVGFVLTLVALRRQLVEVRRWRPASSRARRAVVAWTV